jgi:thiol:disulfide interchange protein DsbA
MAMSRCALLLAVALLAVGCGHRESAGEHAEATSTPSSALAPPVTTTAPKATPDQQQVAGLVPTQPAKVRHANEDGSETVEETAGDSGTHNALLAAVASTMSAATPAAVAATATSAPTMWQEGTNYTRLVPAQPTSVAPGQVEVLEFFWYGCPHCYALDPLIESWRKSKPGFITFTRVPVMWSEGHRSTARLYYTLESMGKLDQLHSDVFKEIHVNNDPLIAPDPNDVAGAERVQTAFISKLGVPEDAFKKAYHGFDVENDLQRADELGQRYRIEGVPTFIINGKYVADVRSAGSPERLLALVTDLAMQEHKH